MRMAITVLTVSQSLLFAAAPARDLAAPIDPDQPQASTTAPQCSTTGTNELKITCAYTAGSPEAADRGTAPRIALNRAVISLNTSEEGRMGVELTFLNDSGNKIVDRRTVYLEIDDVKGQNHVRRPLPHVDFTKLEPGKPMKFQESLLTPAFSPGTYFVSIWIPATDPAWKFNAAHNFLLSSIGVPDAATGLNQIAQFTAKAPKRRGSGAKQDP